MPLLSRLTMRGLLAALLLCPSPALPQTKPAAGDRTATLFQVSTLDALLSGIYDGAFTVEQLRKHGDFGVGAYQGLDGELIALDGHFYQMKANGMLSEVADDERVPFAALTAFKPDLKFSLREVTLARLTELTDTLLASKNYFYAIKVHGVFGMLSTRAIARQFLPYLPLAELIPTQSVFNSTNIRGTAVGFRSPDFVRGINQPGYHFHFVSDDRKMGGHALSFTTGDVTVEVQVLRRHTTVLPEDEPFRRVTLPLP